ncbi:MAG: gliding motility-associated C-terminal domain-containing protein [Chitinophagales bacterium]
MKQLLFISLLLVGMQIGYAQCFDIQTQNGELLSTDIPLCAGNLPVTFVPELPNGTFEGPGFLGGEFNPITGPGEYAITYTITNSSGMPVSCVETITIISADLSATINPLQTVDVSSGEAFVCRNHVPIELTGSLDNNSSVDPNLLSFVIIDAMDPSSQDIVPAPPNNFFTPSDYAPGIYTIQYAYLDQNNGCTSIDEITIYLIETPILELTGIPDTICIGDGAITLPDPFDENGRYESDCFNFSITSPNVFDPTFLSAGTCELTYIYEDFSGVCMVQENKTITILDNPNVSFMTLGAECFSDLDSIVYTGDPVPANAVFNWEVEDGIIVENLGDRILVSWESPGDKLVNLQIDNLSCSNAGFSEMISKTGLEVNTVQDVAIEAGFVVDLATIATSTNDTLDFTFQWSPSTALSCDDCSSPTASPTETTTYVVTAMDELGCAATDTITITVFTSNKIFVANVFTPNDDGTNDELLVRAIGIETMDFNVFNRWGELIFQTTDPNLGWNGTHNGKKVNAGVYVYYVEITFADGQTKLHKGNVTILR